MVTTYKLNTSELGNTLFDSIRTTYPDQVVEIQVREQDETEYLLSTPANREHLEKAIKEEKVITFGTVKEARECADRWAAEN